MRVAAALVAGAVVASGGVAFAHGGAVDPAFFVDIRDVPKNFNDSAVYRGPSGGTFTVNCGRNENEHFNQDNHIVSPGVRNGAHHTHDYVGNTSTDAFSTDASLNAAGTTCRNGDRSAYFWPVLRLVGDGDGDGNSGRVLRPSSVVLKFRGNATSKVTAMPRFLRTVTGDAKAGTNGDANANANWTCANERNKRTDKYPRCQKGQRVLRILDFPSCWDGRNTDSANHRTHIVFPKRDGSCPQGTVAVPQLHIVLSYDVPAGADFAVDSFPEQERNPVTDHADFHNVMSPQIMTRVVDCLNGGKGNDCVE